MKIRNRDGVNDIKHSIFNKKNIYRIIKLLAFLIILLFCLTVVCKITRRKYSYSKTEEFFAQEQDFDVLFFGSSHILYAISPTQLWKDYGIVSYNFGNHGEYIPVSYYNMLLACKETNPKLVVIDAYCIDRDKKHNSSKGYAHNMLDAYKLSYTKFLAVNDIFSDKAVLDRNFEYLFNFSMYHARWAELSEEDLKKTNIYPKGGEEARNVTTFPKINKFDLIDEYSGEETIGIKYVKKIIEYCKENNIEVLVTYLPCIANDEQIAFSKHTKTICDEYNVKYINFLNMDIVNYDTDFNDYSHLNVSGARKITDYLGEYIEGNYNMQDKRNDENYNEWKKDYDAYIDFKISNLNANKSNINNYLMLFYREEDVKYEIKISSKVKLEDESVLKKLLENINNNYEINDEVFIGKTKETIKITTWDKRTGKEIATVWF